MCVISQVKVCLMILEKSQTAEAFVLLVKLRKPLWCHVSEQEATVNGYTTHMHILTVAPYCGKYCHCLCSQQCERSSLVLRETSYHFLCTCWLWFISRWAFASYLKLSTVFPWRLVFSCYYSNSKQMHASKCEIARISTHATLLSFFGRGLNRWIKYVFSYLYHLSYVLTAEQKGF